MIMAYWFAANYLRLFSYNEPWLLRKDIASSLKPNVKSRSLLENCYHI